jgi:hypothetical protein
MHLHENTGNIIPEFGVGSIMFLFEIEKFSMRWEY